MIPGPHFSAGRAMLAPVHYDDQVPSPPSLLKVRRQSLATNQYYFGAAGESLPPREIGRMFERFPAVPEVGRATDGNPSGLDEGPAKPFVAMW